MGEGMSTAAVFRILDTRRRIEAIQRARRNIVIRQQLAAMRASA